MLKLRYTSLQVDTGTAEESSAYEAPVALEGMPVVACVLHSQVGCVAVGFKSVAREARLVYVMTDGGALPLAVSDLVADLRAGGLLDATVTAGQAFGGDHEAVNVCSALDVARGAAAPTRWSSERVPAWSGRVRSGASAGSKSGSCWTLPSAAGGQPIVALRWSDADHRPRHRGLSHHSMSALEHAHARALVPVPRGSRLLPSVDTR